jgi:hypothetical protein
MRHPEDVTAIATACGLTVWPSFIERACDTVAEKYYNGGWRGSKSLSGAFDIFIDIYMLWLRRAGTHLVWLVGADYDQAREEFHFIQEWALRLGLTVHASAAIQGSLGMTIMRKDKPGIITVQTKSAKDPTTLGSVAPVLVLACEAGQFNDEAVRFIRSRTLTYNARIIWNGTFHNEKGYAQYAWYEEESANYYDKPTGRRHVYRLPSWENMALFADCRGMTDDDPSLRYYCPDDNHGPAHSGMNHPKLREQFEGFSHEPEMWRKLYGGEPTGVQNPVYEWARSDNWEKPETNHYLRPMPTGMRKIHSAGGMDFGTVHPSAVTLGSVMDNGETWVWHSVKDTSGDLDWIWQTKKEFSRLYNIHEWGADPMVKYNPTFLETEAMSGSLYAREARVGLVKGVVKKDKLFFDSDDPGVVLLFREMQRVHRRRNSNGQVAYVREEDDMTASFEDMMAMLHGQPFAQLPTHMTLRRPKPQRRYATATPRRGL